MMDDAMVTVASVECGIVPAGLDASQPFHLSGVTITGQEPGHCLVSLGSIQVTVDGQGVLRVTTTFWIWTLDRMVVQ